MARHRGQKWGARDLGMPGLKTWQREALKRIAAKRGKAYVDAAIRLGRIRVNPSWGDQTGADHEAFLQHLNKGAARQLIREVIMPARRRRVRKAKVKRNPSKARRLASKREHWRDRISRQIIREVLSDEGLSRYSRRHRVLRARMYRRKVPIDRILRFNDKHRRNPPRDPIYQGDFPIGREPKRTGPYVDGDTCIVQSPYRAAKGVEAPWEIWVFGMVDPALGERWNYVAGPMGKSDAIEAAKKLVRF